MRGKSDKINNHLLTFKIFQLYIVMQSNAISPSFEKIHILIYLISNLFLVILLVHICQWSGHYIKKLFSVYCNTVQRDNTVLTENKKLMIFTNVEFISGAVLGLLSVYSIFWPPYGVDFFCLNFFWISLPERKCSYADVSLWLRHEYDHRRIHLSILSTSFGE